MIFISKDSVGVATQYNAMQRNEGVPVLVSRTVSYGDGKAHLNWLNAFDTKRHFYQTCFFFSSLTSVLPRQRANTHEVFRRLGRKFAFQSTCFCCYQAPLQNLSGDESVLENIDFFILSRGGKSLCVNKIREHVQWKHTWSIKHNVKQLLLKCHSKPGPQKK